jgi:hypothetical protein
MKKLLIIFFIFTGICDVSKSAIFTGDKLEKHILENIFIFVNNEGRPIRLNFENNPKKVILELYNGNTKVETLNSTWKFNLFKNSIEIKDEPEDISFSFDELNIIDNNKKDIYRYKLVNKEQVRLEKIAEEKKLAELRIAEAKRQEELRQAEIKRQQEKIEQEKRFLQKQKELEEEARLAEIKRQEEQKKTEQKAKQEKILQNILTFLFLVVLIGGTYYFRKKILNFLKENTSFIKEKTSFIKEINFPSAKSFLLHSVLIIFLIIIISWPTKPDQANSYLGFFLGLIIVYYYDYFFVKILNTDSINILFKKDNVETSNEDLVDQKAEKKSSKKEKKNKTKK